MPRGGQNRAPAAVKQRYFDLIWQGLKGAEAARRGVSISTFVDTRPSNCRLQYYRGGDGFMFVSMQCAQGLRVELVRALHGAGVISREEGHRNSLAWEPLPPSCSLVFAAGVGRELGGMAYGAGLPVQLPKAGTVPLRHKSSLTVAQTELSSAMERRVYQGVVTQTLH